MSNLSFRSGAACAAVVRSVRHPFRFRSPPPCPASARARFRSNDRMFRRSGSRFTTRFRPPVPLVCCSFRSWFVSQVRLCSISVRFPFGFRSTLVRFLFSRSVRFCSISVHSAWPCLHPVRSSSVPFRFGLSVCACFVFALCVHVFNFIYSRVYYTRKRPIFKCIFCRKSCVF